MTLNSLEALDARVNQCWQTILSNSKMIQEIMAGGSDKRLYALYLIETYHYTRHNAKNQALVAIRSNDQHNAYLQFCFRHAADEAGHELMAVHDLKQMGVDSQPVLKSRPLPATEVLIAYLYWVSVQGNPVQRLGYSFWAESCYEAIGPVLKAMQTQMKLTPDQMTFFIDHATIDTKHAEMVRQMILQSAQTNQDWEDIGRVMEMSLMLTGRILDDVYESYHNLVTGKPSPYAFLKDLA
ncbi:MAG: iron-containing redox enzyme family protein [Cyanobacteria bacterium]|nr:iron-containing redox enzyme family protein [Cyanobacteriota bacterium]